MPEEAVRFGARLDTISKVAAIAAAADDLVDFGEGAVSVIAEDLGARFLALYLADDDLQVLRPIALFGADQAISSDLRDGLSYDGSHISVEAFHTGEAVVGQPGDLPDPSVLTSQDSTSDLTREVRSFAVLPLQARGRVGVLTLMWDTPAELEDDEQRTLWVLADIIAANIENFTAELHLATAKNALEGALDATRQRTAELEAVLAHLPDGTMATEPEHRIAETLHNELAWIPQHLEGVTIAHSYRPAAEAARIGGDFYDVFEIEPGLIGVLIGDVSGKGLRAAALTSLVRYTVRAHAMEGHRPTEVVRRVNRVLFKTTSPDTFVTMFFGVIDTGEHLISYCDAGHPAPLLVAPDGRLDHLDQVSLVVGAYEDFSYVRGSAQIGPGSLLFLHTDGVVEARHATEEFGEGRLESTVLSAGTDPEASIRAVVGAVERFSAGLLSDDVALMAVRVD